MPREMLAIENVNHPGRTSWVDAAKYAQTKTALLKALPRRVAEPMAY